MDAEKQLVQSILDGNRHAFRELISSYERLVAHMVYRMVTNQNDREDICQDVFVKVYQNLSKFQFKSKLSTWIARIAYNTTLNYLEKKRVALYDDLGARDKTISSGGQFESYDQHYASAELSPEETLLETEVSLQLHAQIERLPILFRTVLTLFHLDQLGYRDISEIMNLPEGTVKSYLFRARKRLKELLLEEQGAKI
ncbi:MAG: RNA polymerase sigma factor [Calditrichia bacterium]